MNFPEHIGLSLSEGGSFSDCRRTHTTSRYDEAECTRL